MNSILKFSAWFFGGFLLGVGVVEVNFTSIAAGLAVWLAGFMFIEAGREK